MVAAVEIDLRVVIFVEDSSDDLDFVAVPWDLHEFIAVPHGFLCMGIVFNSWVVAISGFGHRLHVTRS
jgi:hypothetical protein